MAGSVNKVILDRQSRPRPGDPLDPGRHAHRQFHARDLGKLARPDVGRAQGAHRMAPRRDLQRAARRDRREISAQGLEGLCRGRLADPQMDRPAAARSATRPRSCCNTFRGELTMLDGARGAAQRRRRPAIDGGYDEGTAAAVSPTSRRPAPPRSCRRPRRPAHARSTISTTTSRSNRLRQIPPSAAPGAGGRTPEPDLRLCREGQRAPNWVLPK